MISKANISLVRSLADKKARDQHGLFVVEGRKMVGEAIASGLKVERIFGLEEFSDVPGTETASRKDIERMSSLRTPQGILALVTLPAHDLPAAPGAELTLALDGVQDPGNLGTILRIADWFGIGDVICSPDSADCFNPKAVQASMGAIFRIRVHYTPLEGVLPKTGNVYGAFLEGENIYTADLGPNPAGIIVMGSEGNGITSQVARHITRKLHIPPYPVGKPSSESLNVATATAIICSEFRRRT